MDLYRARRARRSCACRLPPFDRENKMQPHLDMMKVVRANIARHGQHIFFIVPEDEEPAFAYTIGNAVIGLPELLLIGNFSTATSGGILNDLGLKMRSSGQPLAGEISLGGNYPVRIRAASSSATQRYTIQAGRFLGHDHYRVLQILLCDPNGNYPGEPGCDSAYDVPLA